jgi:hypothetical protein
MPITSEKTAMAANENFHQNTEKTFPWNPAMIRVVNDV